MAAQFGRRLRRGATSGAVVAAAVAALAASQAPGVVPPPSDSAAGDRPVGAGEATPPATDGSATGDSPYYTDLPPLNTPNKPGTSIDLPIITGPAEAGIPASVLAAYKRAEQSIRSTDPACNLPWQLLAGIGKVESGQARGGRVDANGTTLSPILGPVLNGVGFANIPDTDDGAFDSDPTNDRAVGPMQFIPSTWATWGQDANGDGRKDPNNIYDAAQAAGMYLCANNRDLAVKADLDRAILSYNRSTEYLRTVLSWFEYYKRGTHQVPDGTGLLPIDRSDTPSTGPTSPSTSAPTTPTPSPSPSTPKPDPSKPVTPQPTKPPVTPPATAKVVTLKDAGTGTLTAPAGDVFAGRPTVEVRDAAGKPAAGLTVRFEIIGATDANLGGVAKSVTVLTGLNGRAVSPPVRAGEKTGTFTVRASVVGQQAAPVSFTATVTERRADTLVRVDTTELTATTGGRFADRILVKATLDGAIASSVGLTATMINSAADPQQNSKGPYFKDAVGNPLRTLTGLKTDAFGLLTLPDIYADDQSGTFLLRLTTPGGGSVTIELNVTAPAPEPEPTPTPTPAASSTATPTASPTP
ncbi:lytic transglycosylase domain-containing protein [Streptomyces sp. P9(2023)]|uniref:lytic transglycosylase domain-containing protein n=1 Tax=Streptomyces sp. P9(2023) TaxID=3064394 RepID=UPI0028F44E75|nr:lytic transglycosylase domain-containing protein [Streptomyces sp. P9(2023)]MDT9687804.1 lytic transglycosylase domain-containing protein [Streptomyces sp. P9(2023)]